MGWNDYIIILLYKKVLDDMVEDLSSLKETKGYYDIIEIAKFLSGT